MAIQRKPRQKYIRCLERRSQYLEQRITTSSLDLTYDKAELNALKWAIQTLKDLYPVDKKDEAPAPASDIPETKEASG